MDDQAHIGLVDAHAKGIGCHNDLHLPFHPQILTFIACLGVQTCMIKRSCNAHRIQPIRNDLRPFAVPHIHDGTPLRHGVQFAVKHTIFVGLMKYIIRQVLAFETALEDIFLLETKTELNVIHNFSSCRCGQSQNRCFGNIGANLSNF